MQKTKKIKRTSVNRWAIKTGTTIQRFYIIDCAAGESGMVYYYGYLYDSLKKSLSEHSYVFSANDLDFLIEEDDIL